MTKDLDMAVTYLFVPAHEPRKAARAMASTADVVIFDLEAGVPEEQKPSGRRAIRDYLTTLRRPDGPELWIRVNIGGRDLEADVTQIDWQHADGAMVPRAEDPAVLTMLHEAGAQHVLPLIESTKGFEALPRLGRVRGVQRFAIGTWDLLVDLGILGVSDPDESELIWQLRGQLIVMSRQLGLKPPVDGVYSRLDDTEGLRAVCQRAYRLGYGGKLLIHPRQIPVVTDVFGPDNGRLQLAREIVEAYERAVGAGIGVIRVRNQMIDLPIVEQARALLSRWPGVLIP